MTGSSLTHIALHGNVEAVLRDAVVTARTRLGVSSAFAAVGTPTVGYAIGIRHGLFEPRWASLVVRSGRGLGGRVLRERRPLLAANYLDDTSITGDYRDVVRAEGLHGIGCVPVSGPDGIAALLYAGGREVNEIGSRSLAEINRIAEVASVGLATVASAQTADRALDRIVAIANRAEQALDPVEVRAHLREIRAVAGGGGGAAERSGVSLTQRERDVLRLLASGARNREIAERLVLAETTVKGYVRALLEKLDASSRLEAVARARSLGLA